MKKTLGLLTTVCLVLFFSCGKKPETPEAAAIQVELQKSADTDQSKASGEKLTIDRKIIKEGEIRFETARAQDTRTHIAKIVSETKGYISNDQVNDQQGNTEHRITIRVPAGQFETLLEKISRQAAKLDSKSINALDVTEEFIDVEARVKTKKELETRYKDLLKKANKVEEILNIEREIGSLRTEIESIEGRLKYLKDKVSYSTLVVVFYEKTGSPFTFNSEMGEALHTGWTNLLWFFVALTKLWPFIIIGLIIIIVYRRKRNKSENIT